VNSLAYPLGTPKKKEFLLTLGRRLLLFFLACCIQMVYIPTSNQIAGGIEPKLPIDVFPIWPIWVLPYILCYLLWFTAIAGIIFRGDDEQFRSFLAACMLTFALGALSFTFFPTFVKSASLEGSDMFTVLLRNIHEGWGRYAALPSGHVYITTLLALFYGRWYPRYRFLWILILVIVSLATLFTGQHYILDVLTGYLVALAGYYFGLWWTGRQESQKRTRKRPGKSVPSSSLN
jgi:membrane-associated phospholipid phosphatase